MQIKSNKLVCFGLVLFMIMTTGICSADSLSVEQVSHINGSDISIAIAGDYAYIGQNYDFVVVDIANPAEPIEIGRIVTPGLVKDIVLKGNYAYLADGENGLVVIDLTTPTSPVVAGIYTINESLYATDIALVDDKAYIIADQGLVIVDISDPSSPVFVDNYGTGGEVLDITVSGTNAYVISSIHPADLVDTKLLILDLTNSSSPNLKGTFETDEIAYSVAVSGNYAYMASETGLLCIDLTNSSSPTLVSSSNYSHNISWISGIAVEGNYVFLAGTSGLEIADISNLSSVYMGMLDDSLWGVAVEGNYAYVASESGFTILRVDESADSLNVEQVGHINGSDRSIAIAGDYAYIGQNYDFVVVDIANPAEPIEIGRIVTPGLVEDIVLKGNYAYLANLGNGLTIVDITDPSSLQILGNNSLSIAWHIAIKENYAYLATPESGLVIVDVTNPFSPQLKNTFNSNMDGGEVTNIAVEGNYAYAVVASGGDLFIVDITDLSSLTLSGTYTAGEIRDVAVNGNYAYVTDIEKGLSILDISNPSNPTLLGMYNNSDTNASTKEVVIAGNYAYVADYARGLLIVDIADPSSPELAGSYYIKKTFDVAVEGNYAYVVSPVDGLTILRVDNTSITTSHTPSYDNRLRESTPTTVLPSSNYIDIGKLSTTRYRDVMAFNLSGYETTDTIDKATLSLYWYYPAGATCTSDTVVEIYRPVEWDPKYVSWKNSASGKAWTNAGGSWYDKNGVSQGTTPYASVTFPAATVPDNKYYEFDVTQLVQDYVSGKYVNTGLFLKAKTESGNYIAFYSSDWTNAAQRPKLSITSTSGSVDNPPVASAGDDTTATTGSAVSFDGSGSTDDKGITSYSWDFDDSDGITSEATGPTATKTYATAGTYTVTLNVTDTAGQISTDTLQVVVTDPVSSVTYTPTNDNRLRESTPTTVLPASNYIDIGKLSTTRYRDVMMFDLSDYNPTDTISKATLSLYWYYPAGATRTSDTVVEIYRPVEWDPKFVSWKNSASGTSWSTAGGNWYDKNGVAQGIAPYASVTFPAGKVPDNKYYDFDVTQLVQEYVNGTYENTGFFLKAQTESGNYIAFYSSDWTNAEQRPKLTITR